MSSGRRRLWLVVVGMIIVAVVVSVGAVLVAHRARRVGSGTSVPPPMQFDPSTVPADTSARVEVLNASGVGGLAREVTTRLRAAGYDVVYYGNAGADDPRRSTVIARLAADSAVARRVAAVLGVSRVETRVDPDRMVDVSVVLGEDFVRPR